MEKIRFAKRSDAAEILEIYRPYVEESTVSFETELPSIKEFEGRIEKIKGQYPYLVYTIDEKVVGYAYASRHRDRAAYDYAVEMSIYTADEVHGKQVAQKLYQKLFAILREQGVYVGYIGYTVPNEKSRKFHEKMGFEWVGTYKNVGYKFEGWHDVVWMVKQITPLEVHPKPLMNIDEVSTSFLNELLGNVNGEKDAKI